MDLYTSQHTYVVPVAQHTTRPAAPSTLALVKKILPLEPSPGFLTTAARAYLPQPGPELPSRNELKILCWAYWSAVDPLAHVVHRPSFDEEFGKYMVNGHVVDAAPVSFKALLLAMCLAAAVSLPSVQQKELSGTHIQSVVGNLKLATEKALADANFMNTSDVQTLQAFTIYLVGSYFVALQDVYALS